MLILQIIYKADLDVAIIESLELRDKRENHFKGIGRRRKLGDWMFTTKDFRQLLLSPSVICGKSFFFDIFPQYTNASKI